MPPAYELSPHDLGSHLSGPRERRSSVATESASRGGRPRMI